MHRVYPLSVTFPFQKLPLVSWIVRPNLLPLSLLQIIHPISLVYNTVVVDIYAKSIRLLVDKITLESIAVDMPKCSNTICLIIFPISLIFSAIRPYLSALSAPFIIFHCTLILYPGLKLNLLKLKISIVFI